MPVSPREWILVAALVIAAVSWYREYEHNREMNQQLESIKQRFGPMLEAEETLRQDPTKKSVRLGISEFVGPKPNLRWSMEVTVLGDGQPDEGKPDEGKASPPPAEAAQSDDAKAGPAEDAKAAPSHEPKSSPPDGGGSASPPDQAK
jgi:hypothetical protein